MMAFSSGVMRYFYPRPPRGRRRENIQCEAKLLAISIHALREEGDHPYSSWERGSNEFLSTPSARRATKTVVGGWKKWLISIHALREEGDALPLHRREPVSGFLSTPSARRATARATSTQHPQVHFYPRPPRGGRRLDAVVDLRPCEFLSTPSARRATRAVIETAQALKNFYPRPPRGGRRRPSVSSLQTCDFYPRPPRGGRRHGFCIKRGKNLFLSTPSARRATPWRPARSSPPSMTFLSTPSARRAT